MNVLDLNCLTKLTKYDDKLQTPQRASAPQQFDASYIKTTSLNLFVN
jgi:hypothetical protein